IALIASANAGNGRFTGVLLQLAWNVQCRRGASIESVAAICKWQRLTSVLRPRWPRRFCAENSRRRRFRAPWPGVFRGRRRDDAGDFQTADATLLGAGSVLPPGHDRVTFATVVGAQSTGEQC